MAKRPIKQIEVPGTTPTTYDIQDNTLVQGTNITITEEADGTRKINADVPVKAITTAPGDHIGEVGTPTVSATTSGTTTTLTFNYLKGAKGDKGNTGDTGPAGADGDDGVDGLDIFYSSASATSLTNTIAISSITKPDNHSVSVGDLIIANSLLFYVSAVDSTNATVVYKASLKGAKGDDGLTTSVKVNGTTYTQSGGLITLTPTFITTSNTSGLVKNDGSIDTTSYSTFSGSYNDLTNKPTIPTATSDLTNDSGFITGINSSDVTTALGYTPLSAESNTVKGTDTNIQYIIGKRSGAVSGNNNYINTEVYFKGNKLYSGSNPVLTSAVTSVAISNDTNGGLTVSSGSPITSSGTIKLKHSNVLSASGTIGSSSASSGSTVSVPYANYDINGHITSKGTHTHTINNLTSSAINSGYKLPTTTEWNEKASVTVNPSSTTNTITSIGINGTNYQLGTFQQLGVAYYMATCNQPTTTKTVTLPSYSLTTNASAIIYFMYESTSSNTLNINSTGAKTMRINNNTISSTNRLIEGIYFVRYSGTYYDCYYMSTVGKKYLHRTQLNIRESASSARYCQLILNWWSSNPSPYTSASSLMLEFGGNDYYDAQFDQDGVQFSGYFEYTSTNYVPIVKFSFRQEWEYDGEDEYYVDTYCDVMYTRSASSTTTLSWGSVDFANLASVTDYVIK